MQTQTPFRTDKCMMGEGKKREEKKERERDWSATVLSDWRWQAGRVTGSCTCKPAPWIYLFDFASSVHRSLRVRATVFNCWPQDPLQTPPSLLPRCPLPPHLVPFENINSGKRACLFAFSLPSFPWNGAWKWLTGMEEKTGSGVGGGGRGAVYTHWCHAPKTQSNCRSSDENKRNHTAPLNNLWHIHL